MTEPTSSGMTEAQRQQAIGRSVERLIDLALQDEALRPGLEATARFVLQALRAEVSQVATADEPEASMHDGSDALNLQVDGSRPAGTVPAVPEPGEPMPGEPEPGGPEVAPVRHREPRESVPMARGELLALIEDAVRHAEAGDRGSFGEALLGGVGGDRLESPEPPVTSAPAPEDQEERDAVLPGIVTRARIRAEVARAVGERERRGTPVDEALIHRARSEGAAPWMTDLLHPAVEAVEVFAECLDALADVAEMVVLLRTYEPYDQLRRAQAVKDLAAVQSALRVATTALRNSSDEDQLAAFHWLVAVTKVERIFVERHMRLSDPLDPAHLADVVVPVHAGLAVLKDRATREASRKKQLNKLRYLAHQLETGKGTALDPDKVVESVTGLVVDGMPASSLQLRDILLPIAGQLPPQDGRSAEYGRVMRELDLQRDRVAQTASETQSELDDPRDPDDALAAGVTSPSDAVRLARERLDRLAIPESATETTEELDAAAESPAWGRSTWRALRALHTYATQAAGFGGFWDWCENSGHPHAWPATSKKLAMNESLTAMHAHGEDRVFKVDPRVSAAGELVMEAHCKVAEGGGRLAPRIYFHDDTRGVTGLVHIGFVGPHRYVRNASTN